MAPLKKCPECGSAAIEVMGEPGWRQTFTCKDCGMATFADLLESYGPVQTVSEEDLARSDSLTERDVGRKFIVVQGTMHFIT